MLQQADIPTIAAAIPKGQVLGILIWTPLTAMALTVMSARLTVLSTLAKRYTTL